MSLRDEEVLQAVIVIVEEMSAPTRERQCRSADTGRVGDVAEAAVAVLSKQPVSFVREIGDDDVRASVVIVVAEIDAHARKRLAVFGESHARREAKFFERAIAIVVIEE